MTTAAEYRIEHVAQTPEGFHVRTFAPGPRSDHLVRVAFPPGRRRRGSGTLVEVLHPPGENPTRCKNPSSVYSYAVSIGYPYLRGEGRVAEDGRTWLSRVQKTSDAGSPAIFVGWDQVNRKWIIEKESGQNPSHEARELYLWIRNTEKLWMRQGAEIKKNLLQKYQKGTYDHALAPKLWKYLAESGAKDYCREFGCAKAQVFPKAVLEETAQQLADEYYDDLKAGTDLPSLNPARKGEARFTPEEDRVWTQAFEFWVNEGKTDAQADRLAAIDVRREFPRLRKFKKFSPLPGIEQPELKKNPSLYDAIRHGDKVTIVDRDGQSRTGRAVMRGPAGWVLNMGGAHGTPAIASPENVTRVRATNPEKAPRPKKGETVPEYHARRVRELLRKMPKAIRGVFDRNPATYKFVFRNADDSLTRVGKMLRYQTDTKEIADQWAKHWASRGFKVTRRKLGNDFIVEATPTRRSNPDDGELERAEELFETFHGKEPREILEMQESSEMRGDFTALGDLVELTMVAPNGDHVLIKFKNDGVRVASSPEGSQLYLLGGNQDISGHLQMFGADESKDLIDLGDAKQIVYEAAKWQTKFDPQEWKHDFGEESGVRPRGFYDQIKQRIFFAGGNYKVKRPGIVD